MDATLQKLLLDRVYEKRKAATLELEKLAREALAKNDRAKINLFVQQLCSLLESNPSSSSNPQSVNARNGGLIGIAGIGIALGVEIAAYLEQIVPPVLACFVDPDSKIRYFACESFYNIAKVCKGEILMYFNEIFDALSKLAADTELSVKNGAELLDRLLKDIVCETAPHYVSQYQDIPLIRARQDATEGNLGGRAELDVAREKVAQLSEDADVAANKAFSLARFVPLLVERIYVLSPFTRNYLVSWITVLDSVPDLELVTYLPHFFDGLLKYLSDPNTDVRVATAKVLADFLREIQEAAEVARMRKEVLERTTSDPGVSSEKKDGKEAMKVDDNAKDTNADETGGTAVEEDWMPAQEVRIDYVTIMEILLNHIAYPDEEIQATTQQWIAELLNVVKEVVIPFTPRIIPAILPNIAHHSPAIQVAANALNVSLYQVIEEMEWGRPGGKAISEVGSSAGSPPTAPEGLEKRRVVSSPPTSPQLRPIVESRSSNNIGALGLEVVRSNSTGKSDVSDPFNLQATVNVLTLQLIDEHEETRVSALEWLLMLHQKAPRRILSIDDGTFPALLKTLSDPSEDVVRCDLRLLAQMSGASDDAYNSYLANLVSLFSTDRGLLEARGSLIVRQLCTTLPTERVFRTLAEILEQDEDLEFASIMVTNLNMILLTSPELGDFRKRLKNLETRDGQNLFVSLYRSWCHNAVASLTLCLLAQAYEHAASLLSIFPDLEISVPFLIQIDKLVQLLESPVFMTLRLQLLEPERHPHLLKTLYGVLMLLPQSSAFATLRNRLNAVSALGYLHVGTARAGGLGQSGSSSGSISSPASTGGATNQSGSSTSNVASTRSKIVGSNREELKWNELLVHFKAVQGRHERARRAAQAGTANGGMGQMADGGVLLDGRSSTSGPTGLGGATSGGRLAGIGGLSRTGAGSSNRSGSAAGGGLRRTAAGASGAGSNSAGLRSSSVSSSRSRNEGGGGATDRSMANANAGSTSFFRLPIGPTGVARAAPPSAAQANAGARPTSPPIARRSGSNTLNTASAVPGLISRTMSLNNAQRNR